MFLRSILAFVLMAPAAQAGERPIRPTYAAKGERKITRSSLEAERKQFEKVGEVLEFREKIRVQKVAIENKKHIYDTTEDLASRGYATQMSVLKSKMDWDVAQIKLKLLKAQQEKSIAQAIIHKYTIIEQGDEKDMRLEIAQETENRYNAEIAIYESQLAIINTQLPYLRRVKENKEKLKKEGSLSLKVSDLNAAIYNYKNAGVKKRSLKYLIKAMRLARKSVHKSIQRLQDQRNTQPIITE